MQRAESTVTTEPKPFGGVLERLRLAAGLTPEAPAKRAGLSARALSELERNRTRTPRLESITLLADAVMLDPRQRASRRDRAIYEPHLRDARSRLGEAAWQATPAECRKLAEDEAITYTL